MATFALMALAYILGSIPCGLLLAQIFAGVDIRNAGSGNIGAQNVLRTAGVKLGVLTLAGDALKGSIPALIALRLLGITGWQAQTWVSIIALCAFLGHLFSVFLGFKGGKGVATAAGCFLVLSPLALVVCFALYVLVVCIWGYSSLGSLAAAAMLPGAVWVMSHSIPFLICALIMTIFVFARHAGNIKRLLSGTEPSMFKS